MFNPKVFHSTPPEFILSTEKKMSIKNKKTIDNYFILIYNEVRKEVKMAKLVKYIALTHTPTTHIICIPAKVVKDMNITTDKDIQIEYDDVEKVMIIKKIKE